MALDTEDPGPIQRVVSVFEKESSQFVKLIPLQHFSLEKYKATFDVPANDPSMHEFYEISPEHMPLFRDENIGFAFDEHIYYVECARIEKESSA
ncbi:DUF7683 domain-containing protein [Tellurirhabdus bombi]|uniref:DUF7683 domain-containing protein n=1 Tax=Tellurirhabdus bombi TaxID=2907205 RepID=UPI001F33EAEC|nr:hypothetical protein [Tellurirhabdus bombi]